MHLEGTAVLVISVLAYRWSHGGWLQFALLFLLPDLSMIGYVPNVRIGPITYNAIHTYVGPLALAGFSVAGGHQKWLLLSLIRIAKIDRDRMLGFGLKYPTRFKDTHLTRLVMVWRLGTQCRGASLPRPAAGYTLSI